jgi:hypothetical protein
MDTSSSDTPRAKPPSQGPTNTSSPQRTDASPQVNQLVRITNPKRLKLAFQWIAAITAVVGMIVAITSLAAALWNFGKQIEIQNRMARQRIEEDYLRRALFVVFDWHKAAEVYVGSWVQYKKTAGIQSAWAAPIADQISMNKDLIEEWRRFDRELSAMSEVIKATGRDPDLKNILDDLQHASAAVVDELLDNPDKYTSEDLFEASEKTKRAQTATRKAADALARRLEALYNKAEGHAK